MTINDKRVMFIAAHSADSTVDVNRILSRAGFILSLCSSSDEILSEIAKGLPDIIIADGPFSGSGSIMDVLKDVIDEHDIPVIFITESADDNLIARTTVIAPYTFMVKPVKEQEFISNITAAVIRHEKKIRLKESMLDEIRRREIFGTLSGESYVIRDVLLKATIILDRNINVLITGESGTGKELLARAIHKGSHRKGPFIAVNCAAISTELSDSLLFGHSRGAFTGAFTDHAGYFEQANGGTIFLDEIGDMKPDIQAKVLRVIEDKKIRRVGEKTERDIDMRIISATNRNLKESVNRSEFRSDLYYRLEEYQIYIPPLRERKEDIPVIAEYFLESLSVFYELEPMQLSESAMNTLTGYSWPGNVRELKNVIQRSAIQNSGSIIEHVEIQGETKPTSKYEENISSHESDNSDSSTDEAVETLRELERRVIKQALVFTKGNVKQAAMILDIGRATLYRKIEKLGIRLHSKK